MQKPIILKLFLISLLIGFFFSCNSAKSIQQQKTNAGVVITFDDCFIKEWNDADMQLAKYKWKATFCVSNVPQITKNDFGTLKNFQLKGHEIAGHGYNHINAKEFSKKHGKKKYIETEITPLIQAFQHQGIILNSFAYPFGAKTQTLDSELKKHFKIIRATAGGYKKVRNNSNFYNGKPILNGIGIDTRYKHFSIKYITKVLNYAKRNNKVVIFYAHKPVTKATANYEVEMKTLEFICQYVRNNQMQFYTLNDLNSLKKR